MKPVVKELLSRPLSCVFFHGHHLTFCFDGEKHTYFIKFGHARNHVGEWHRQRPVLFVDEKLKGDDRLSIALHEAIEKRMAQKYGLDVDSEAHKVAVTIERKWYRMRHKNWRSHQMKVYWIWKKRGAK
jgi:hypothetical protein